MPKPHRKTTAVAKVNGRPTKYDPRFDRIAGKFAMLGLTIEETAVAMQLAPSSLYKWMNEHPSFSEAVIQGRGGSDSDVAKSLYVRAMGYSHPAVKIMTVGGAVRVVPYTEHYPPDTAACIFWLKNRQPKLWRDKVEQQITGVDDGPIQIQTSQPALTAFESRLNAMLVLDGDKS